MVRFYMCFRRPIHSGYPKISMKGSKSMLTRTQRLSLCVKLPRARTKETMSTTSTRSVTNVKGQTPSTEFNLNLESSFFLFMVKT